MINNILSIILWICIIGVITIASSVYAKKQKRPDAIIALYVSIVLISNILAFKLASFELGFMTVFGPAATILFPVTFLLTDVVTQSYGKKETIRMIRTAFLCQIAVVVFTYLAVQLSPAPFWSGQAAFAEIFNVTPRIVLASLIAFYISETTDAHLFAKLKEITKGKHLWLRSVVSSVPAMALDTVIFVAIAFYGIAPLWPLMYGVVILKWCVGLIDIPFLYLHRRILGTVRASKTN